MIKYNSNLSKAIPIRVKIDAAAERIANPWHILAMAKPSVHRWLQISVER